MLGASQLFAHQRARSMQATANGAHRDTQDACDRFVVESLDFPEHQDGAEFLAEPRQGGLDLLSAFGAKESFGGRISRVGGVISPRARLGFQGDFGTRPPLAIQGGVECDAIEPGIKRAMAAKGLELQQGLDERVLDNILSFLTLAHDVHDAGIESVLIETHQLTEGGGIALESLFDQQCFTGHGVRVSIDETVENRAARKGGRSAVRPDLARAALFPML